MVIVCAEIYKLEFFALSFNKKVRFSFSAPFEMDHDDDEGVGFIRESHYLKSPTIEQQQAMALLQIPRRDNIREGSISSNVSDLDVPIYSSENLTTRPRREVRGVCILFLVINVSDVSIFMTGSTYVKKYVVVITTKFFTFGKKKPHLKQARIQHVF